MSNFSDLFGGGIKSIQRGVTTPTTLGELLVTVSAVDMARAQLNLLSACSYLEPNRLNTNTISLRLVNSTTIGVTSQGLAESSPHKYLPCSWELIEYM